MFKSAGLCGVLENREESNAVQQEGCVQVHLLAVRGDRYDEVRRLHRAVLQVLGGEHEQHGCALLLDVYLFEQRHVQGREAAEVPAV